MLANAWRFRRLLRDWAPDVLVTCNWGAIEFALANLPPLTRHVHVVDGFGPEERDTQIARRVWLRRLVLRNTPVVLPSRTLVRIARDVWKLPPRVIRYVPNGIDLDRFSPVGPAPADPIGSGLATAAVTPSGLAPARVEPVIGTVAALRPEKKLGRLLQALATLPAGRLVIVGDGPERPALLQQAQQLGIASRVTFAGHQRDTAALYRRFDLFALSSDTEQMPLSVMEAMASGLPVVSTDVGDVANMVAEENAPYITRLDPASFAAALQALITDPGQRSRLGLANHRKARAEFDEASRFAAHGALWRGSAATA